MTGTMFGCLTTHKALKDCSWDYDTYECVMCTIQESDQDLGYHVVHHYDDDEKHWEEQCAANDYFWGYLQVGLCGVYPRASYSWTSIPQSRGECFGGESYKPSIGTDGNHCVCVKPNESLENTENEIANDVFAA